MANGRSSSLAVFILGMGMMGVLLYIPTIEPVWIDQDGVRFFPFKGCIPDNMRFDYTCEDIVRAEKLARADAKVIELVDGNRYHLVGFDYQDDPTSQNNIRPLLNLHFFVEGQNRAMGVVVDLDLNRVVVAAYSPSLS